MVAPVNRKQEYKLIICLLAVLFKAANSGDDMHFHHMP